MLRVKASVDDAVTVLDVEGFSELFEVVVGDRLIDFLVADLHIDFRRFLNRLDQTEDLIQGLAGAEDAVLSPDDAAVFLHKLCRLFSDEGSA